jgi:hypothetical protein
MMMHCETCIEDSLRPVETMAKTGDAPEACIVGRCRKCWVLAHAMRHVYVSEVLFQSSIIRYINQKVSG